MLHKKKMYGLPLVLEPQPEGGYVVTCPILPELITEGDTVQEALLNARDALVTICEPSHLIQHDECHTSST